MKKHQEKLLVAVLAGIIILSGAAFAVQPLANNAHGPRVFVQQTSALDGTLVLGAPGEPATSSDLS